MYRRPRPRLYHPHASASAIVGPFGGRCFFFPSFLYRRAAARNAGIIYLFVVLGHGVQSTAVLEPLDLASIEGVGQLDLEGLAVLGLDDHRKGLADLELGALQVNLCRVC